jgi:hypothetical protein
MMKSAIALAALLCLLPRDSYSEGRINVRIDFSHANAEGAYNHVGIDWQGLEVEIEKAFAKHKIVASGFSFGVRRELFYGFTGFGETKGVQRWDEGTYLTLRVYRSFDISGHKSWFINPSFAILYGIPGTTLDRTIAARQEDGALDYTHVFPMRNAEVPKLLADKAQVGTSSALLYPEVSVSIKKQFAGGGMNLEWLGGVRIIRFGIIDSSDRGDLFKQRQTFVPSFGMRVGFRIF